MHSKSRFTLEKRRQMRMATIHIWDGPSLNDSLVSIAKSLTVAVGVSFSIVPILILNYRSPDIPVIYHPGKALMIRLSKALIDPPGLQLSSLWRCIRLSIPPFGKSHRDLLNCIQRTYYCPTPLVPCPSDWPDDLLLVTFRGFASTSALISRYRNGNTRTGTGTGAMGTCMAIIRRPGIRYCLNLGIGSYWTFCLWTRFYNRGSRCMSLIRRVLSYVCTELRRHQYLSNIRFGLCSGVWIRWHGYWIGRVRVEGGMFSVSVRFEGITVDWCGIHASSLVWYFLLVFLLLW